MGGRGRKAGVVGGGGGGGAASARRGGRRRARSWACARRVMGRRTRRGGHRLWLGSAADMLSLGRAVARKRRWTRRRATLKKAAVRAGQRRDDGAPRTSASCAAPGRRARKKKLHACLAIKRETGTQAGNASHGRIGLTGAAEGSAQPLVLKQKLQNKILFLKKKKKQTKKKQKNKKTKKLVGKKLENPGAHIPAAERTRCSPCTCSRSSSRR